MQCINGITSDAEPAPNRYGIMFPDPAKEKEEMLKRFAEANRRSRRFSAIVVLNLDYNLACDYCFEEVVRGQQAMSPPYFSGSSRKNRLPSMILYPGPNAGIE
jgi:hypothetical protein